MAYYEDLSAYAYHEIRLAHAGRAPTLNVGWLAAGHDFARAEPREAVLD